MTKKRKRKQSDSEYSAGKCDDLAKAVHKEKMKKQKVKDHLLTSVSKPTKPTLQVESKPLQLIFKAAESKKRLIYFKYPDELEFIKLNPTHMQQITESLEDMLRTHPEYQVPFKRTSVKKKQSNTQDNAKSVEVKEPPKPILIRQLMRFGLNETVRKIPSGQIAFVLLLDPLTTHLQKVMLEIAFSNQVPIAFASTLNDICDLFHLPTAMCVAFTKQAAQDDSVLKPTLDRLLQMYQQQQLQSKATDCKSLSSAPTESISNKKSKKKPKINFRIPLPEFVYNIKEEPKPKVDLNQDFTFVDRKSDSNNLGSFTSVSSTKDDYFPPRSFYAPIVK